MTFYSEYLFIARMDPIPWNEQTARAIAPACQARRDAPEWDTMWAMFQSVARQRLAACPPVRGVAHEDIVSAAFARFWRALGRIRRAKGLYSVAVRCVQSTAIDAHRRNASWRQYQVAVESFSRGEDDTPEDRVFVTRETARGILHSREVLNG